MDTSGVLSLCTKMYVCCMLTAKKYISCRSSLKHHLTKPRHILNRKSEFKEVVALSNFRHPCLRLWVLLLYFKHTLLRYNLHLGRLFQSRSYTKQILQGKKGATAKSQTGLIEVKQHDSDSINWQCRPHKKSISVGHFQRFRRSSCQAPLNIQCSWPPLAMTIQHHPNFEIEILKALDTAGLCLLFGF